MPKYLYNFGYTVPGRPKNSDFEDSRRIFIIADNSEKALEWGDHLSEEYIENLKKATGEFTEKSVSWVETEKELHDRGSLKYYLETFVLRYGEEVDLGVIFKEWEKKEKNVDRGREETFR